MRLTLIATLNMLCNHSFENERDKRSCPSFIALVLEYSMLLLYSVWHSKFIFHYSSKLSFHHTQVSLFIFPLTHLHNFSPSSSPSATFSMILFFFFLFHTTDSWSYWQFSVFFSLGAIYAVVFNFHMWSNVSNETEIL